MDKAFSLVELSIVLVILGLLTGGILAGQSLIHAAELRALTTEYNKYIAATLAFRDKYFALPGDITNATSFWGILAGTGSDDTCQTTTATGLPTCNGDGDGSLLDVVGATTHNPYLSNNGYENGRYWQHLANAGLIEGQYSGVITTAASHVPGTNVPASKLPNGFFIIYNGPTYNSTGASTYYAGSTARFAGDYGKTFFEYSKVGGNNAVTGGQPLLAEEAWNIDTKWDDGAPGTGKIIGWKGKVATPCTDKAGGAVVSDPGAVYNLSDTNKDCTLDFLRAF